MALGLALGAGAAVLLKGRYMRSESKHSEAGIVVLFAFVSYLLAQALTLSGIVSTLFCAMVLSRYGRPNMSADADLQARLQPLLSAAAAIDPDGPAGCLLATH
jgi:sodium/hydrogen exchanger 8